MVAAAALGQVRALTNRAVLLQGPIPRRKITLWKRVATIEGLSAFAHPLDELTLTTLARAWDAQGQRACILAVRIGGTGKKSSVAATPDDHV